MSSCTSCGSPIPDGQGHSCSMCYGDPAYGRDGYYAEYLQRQEEAAAAQRHAEEQQMEDERRQQES